MCGIVALHDGRQRLYILDENLSNVSQVREAQVKSGTAQHTDLVKRCQVAVGERGKENIFFEIVTALVEIHHDALKLQIHLEDARGDQPPDAKAVFFAF